MGFILVVAGLLMIVTGAKGTYAQFGAQVASEFQGDKNFTYWLVAIGSVGALGYIENLRAFSRLFMALILVSVFLSNQGFFAKLTEALKTGPVAPNLPNASGASGTVSNGTTGGGSTPSFKESLTKPGGGGFWDWIGAPGTRDWLFGPEPQKGAAQ